MMVFISSRFLNYFKYAYAGRQRIGFESLNPLFVTVNKANVHNNLSSSSTRHNSSASNSQRKILSTSKVLYDGDCKLCQIEISALQRWTKNKDNIEFINISTPEYDSQHWGGVSYEDAMKEMHVVGPDGKVYTRGDAVRHMYRVCGLGFLAAFTELPLIRPVCDQLYVHFAKYRLEKALDRCDSNSCDIKLKHLRDKLESENKKS